MYKVHYKVTGKDHDGYCSGKDADEEEEVFAQEQIDYVKSDDIVGDMSYFNKHHDGCCGGNGMCSGYYQDYVCTFVEKMTDWEIFVYKNPIKRIYLQPSDDYIRKQKLLDSIRIQKSKLSLAIQKAEHYRKRLINANDYDKSSITDFISMKEKEYDRIKIMIKKLENELV